MKLFLMWVLLIGSVQAQNIASPWFSFSTGSGTAASGNTAVGMSVGESFTSVSQAGNAVLRSGFYGGVAGESFVTGVSRETALPLNFELLQNYPNPFNPSTTIQYEVAVTSRVIVAIYNLLGQQVTELVHEEKGPGRYSIVWHGRNNEGVQVSSGVYFYRIQAESIAGVKQDFVMTRKLVFLK